MPITQGERPKTKNQMNTDQIASLIRSGLKIGGALLVAHGLTAYADVLNMPDVFGLALALAGLIGSHYKHASAADGTLPPGPLKAALVLLVAALAVTGCTSVMNTPGGKIVSITERGLGLKLSQNSATQTPEGWLGFFSSTIMFVPTTTNGTVGAPNFANTFDASNSGMFDTAIGENLASGNYSTFEPGQTNSAPATVPIVPK